MGLLGIISGTILLRDFERELQEELIETPFGTARVLVGRKFAYIARHGTDRRRPILPHLINHQANISALKHIGVDEIITVNSTGSLKKRLKPGMLAVPNDFISFSATPTAYREGKALHVVPSFSARMRAALLDAARDCSIPVHDGGIYWQTPGPRFETRAEIAMMSQFADLVGMTMASEAVIAKELDLEYAAICSIDNYANGLVEKELALKEVLSHARRSTETMIRILIKLLERRDE
jgi:5'-methylthioadenosine phosphorylase